MRYEEYLKADPDELIQVIEKEQGFWNRGVDVVNLLGKYQREILIPVIKDSQHFNKLLTSYGAMFLFEAGYIQGIRTERKRRNAKTQRRSHDA